MRTPLPAARAAVTAIQGFSHPSDSDVPTNRDRGHGRPARVGPTESTIARSGARRVKRLQLSGCAWGTRRGHYGNCALLINAPHLRLMAKPTLPPLLGFCSGFSARPLPSRVRRNTAALRLHPCVALERLRSAAALRR